MHSGQTNPPITKQFPDNKLVDVIIYTASLISDLRSIDSKLNALRQVTARSQSPISERDKSSLHSLQQKLEDTLVNQERFRTFSYETLHLHIRRHFDKTADRTVHRLTWWLSGIVATAIIAAATTFVFAGRVQHTAQSAISLSVFYLVLYAGTALLLASARKEVTKEVWRAYTYLSGALFCIAAVTPIQPILGLFAPNSPFAPTIMVSTLGLACIPFYLGARKLALVTGVQTRLTSYPVIAMLVAGATLIYVLLAFLTVPIRTGPLTTPYIISVAVSHGLLMLNLIISAALLAKARSRASFLYRRSMTALMQVFIFNAANCLYFLVYWYTAHDIASDNPYLVLGAVALIIESALYLRAGYLFKKTHLS